LGEGQAVFSYGSLLPWTAIEIDSAKTPGISWERSDDASFTA
jgi:hypothetical protein